MEVYMNNFISIFNEIYVKFMGKYYNSSRILKENKDITEKEEYYLDIIYKVKKITLTDFATKCKITKPAATQIANKFIDKKYIVKTTCTHDKRVSYLELTEDMKIYFQNSYKKLDELYNECLSFLSKEEIEILNKILIKINRNL